MWTSSKQPGASALTDAASLAETFKNAKPSNPDEPEEFNPEITQKLAGQELPAPVRRLAYALAARHGMVMAARETGGLHLYMASPEALKRDGIRELSKRHLAVNVDKFLGIGAYAGAIPSDAAALCMKTDVRYLVSELLLWTPLKKRGISDAEAIVVVRDDSAVLVNDGRGNMIPRPPGRCIPLQDLDDDHPAIRYLRIRKQEVGPLVRMFRAAWCEQELPEDRVTRVFYRRLPGGFKATPQGRIILFFDVEGVQRGWQARVLDIKVGGFRCYWHPYKRDWVPVECDGELLPGFRPGDDRFDWDMAKYVFPPGTKRNSLLGGLDAAVAWDRANGNRRRCVLVEGGFDAARCDGPTIPFLGKFFSEEQGKLVAKYFDHALMLPDNDKAGAESLKYVKANLMPLLKTFATKDVPDSSKDPGDMETLAAQSLISDFLFPK